MGYLYSQESVGDGIEGCSGGFFVPGIPSFMTYNRNVIKLWVCIPELVLMKEKMLFERVLQVERYRISDNCDGVLLLFDKAKISLVKYIPHTNDFEVQSLKFFERDEFDIRNEDIRRIRTAADIGVFQMSKYYFGIFPLHQNTFSAKVFKFADVDEKIRNPIDFAFLEGYSIPTICFIYNPQPRRYTVCADYSAIVFSMDLDSWKFHVVDEFVVPCGAFRVVCSGTILLFISPNLILVRSTTSSYHISVNKMAGVPGYDCPSSVVLFDAHCFFKGKSCLVFNGNGDRYRIRVVMDIKRIIGASLVFEEGGPVPSCVDCVKDFLLLGSIGDGMRLFVIRSFEANVEDNSRTKLESLHQRQVDSFELKIKDQADKEDEYYRLFVTGTISEIDEDFSLEQVDEIPGVGFLNGMSMRNEEMVFTSEGVFPCVCVVKNSVTFDILKRIKVKGYKFCSKVLGFYVLSNSKETRVFSLEEGLQNVEGEYIRDAETVLFAELENGSTVQVTPNFVLNLDLNLKKIRKVEFSRNIVGARMTSSGRFLILRDTDGAIQCSDIAMNIVATFSSTDCFAEAEDKIFVLSRGRVSIFDLERCVSLLLSDPVDNIPSTIPFRARQRESHSDQNCASDMPGDRIVEMCAHRTRRKMLLLFRFVDCGMILYESLCIETFLSESVPIKDIQFFRTGLPRHILFDIPLTERAFYKIGNFLFIKSTTNMFMFPTDRGHTLCKSSYQVRSMCACEDAVLSLSKGWLTLCKKQWEERNSVFCGRFAVKRIPVKRIPKYIEHTDGYVVIASCNEVPFSQCEDKDCGIPVYTYRFYIDLYSTEYKHIGTYELSENEHVFHMRYLVLDDKQGNDGKAPFLVICTTFIEGEDKPARGRLHVLEVISVVPEPDNLFKDAKLRALGIEKTKGSIVQCEEVRGNIVLCSGTKIMIYRIDRSRGIIPVGFHDLHIFTSSIAVVKNYILASDIYRGVYFFYLQSKPVRLHLLGCGEPLESATSAGLMTFDEELSILCSDREGTIHVYTYSPNNILSLEGTKLIKRAEVRTKFGKLSVSRIGFRLGGIMFCSESNIVVHMSGVDEQTYYKLMNLHTSIVDCLRDTLGLHHGDYLDSDVHLHSLSLKGPVSLHFLNEFFNLDLKTQNAVCASVKMDRGEVFGLISALNS